MENSIVNTKSFEFSVRIVNLYRFLCEQKKDFILSKQLLRSGTSIGANIREALQAQGKKDFLSKINIALKEANETIYWIELLHATDFIDVKQKESIWKDCDEIIRMLVSTVKTTKRNLTQEEKRGKKDDG